MYSLPTLTVRNYICLSFTCAIEELRAKYNRRQSMIQQRGFFCSLIKDVSAFFYSTIKKSLSPTCSYNGPGCKFHRSGWPRLSCSFDWESPPGSSSSTKHMVSPPQTWLWPCSLASRPSSTLLFILRGISSLPWYPLTGTKLALK